MKVRLISIGRLPWYRKDGPLFFFYTPRMGLPYIAAATPPGWDVEILDGVDVSDIRLDDPVDLVGFSILTPFARDSYRAASLYRERGVPVVLGGVHPSLVPDEAAGFADAVVLGEGDKTWPQLLQDFERGELKKFYAVDPPPQLGALPSPACSLIRNKDDYCVADGFPIVRGCPHGRHCRFCTVPKVFGDTYRVTPIARIVEELGHSQSDGGPAGINVSACCPLNHRAYIKEFAEAVRPMAVNWCGAGLLHMLNDERMLALFRASGCECIYTESEVTSERKDRRKFETYYDVVRMIHENGMAVSYNFTIGFDEDTAQVYEDVESFIDRTGLGRDRCAVQLFAPWPGTDAFRELDTQGRIIDRDWSNYDNTRVVFQPKQMSVEELGALSSGG